MHRKRISSDARSKQILHLRLTYVRVKMIISNLLFRVSLAKVLSICISYIGFILFFIYAPASVSKALEIAGETTSNMFSYLYQSIDSQALILLRSVISEQMLVLLLVELVAWVFFSILLVGPYLKRMTKP